MELSTRYRPDEFEDAINKEWLDAKVFEPAADGPTYTVMIPPPNVTGVLHMGHALNGTVQDIVMRHRRMQGMAALWVPGTDHAGIATQAVVEKKLYAEEKKTREDMGRDAFLAEVWKWREEHGNYILQQFKRLGASCDWSRTYFTLDDDMSRAVRESFVRLWEKGLVYRGARLVNWDCALETAVSDDEIEMVERKDKLYFLKYPVQGQEGRFVTVATTRPETMLGDTGVAVHPEDERYGDLVGGHLLLPFVDRPIPVVADETVDPKFGTGAVKVTPGHDPADYERGARHNLPIINILSKGGKLNEEGGPFEGLSIQAARKEVLAKLDEMGLLEKTEALTHNVPVSDRSKTVIEPMVSEQWFVKMEPLAKPAIAAVKTGRLQFRPERWSKVYLDWLENVRDWCISRQLWWGHQIPVWYDEDGVAVASVDELTIGDAHPKTGKPIVRQDEDVLDTWASSWLVPFSSLGWPDKTPDLERFYPTQFLSTAREIIYLWVARMVMAGYEFLDHLPEEQRCPFDVCYINATVLDAKGRRMSKSAGNGIDPIEMIEKYGADAVRYSLVLLTKEGQDVKLSPDRFEQGYRFGNKVWNAARFVMMNLAGERTDGTSASAERLEDRWILSRLARTRADVSEALEAYRFNDAATALYRFVWNEFCDWYVEIVKSRLNDDDPSAPAARGTLARVLSDALALLHPFTPFMTEVLWKELDKVLGRSSGLLTSGPWPEGEALAVDEGAEGEMGILQDLVHATRRVRNLTMAGERQPLTARVSAPRETDRSILTQHEATVRALAYLESCDVAEQMERPPSSAVAVAGGIEVFIVLGEDVDLANLKTVLDKRAEKVKKGIGQSEGKLKNEGFLKRADPEVVELERERLGEMQLELELLERNLAGF